jgi:hypothetical protein
MNGQPVSRCGRPEFDQKRVGLRVIQGRRPLVGARAAAPRRLTHTISMKRTRKSRLCAGGTADSENALWRSFALW